MLKSMKNVLKKTNFWWTQTPTPNRIIHMSIIFLSKFCFIFLMDMDVVWRNLKSESRRLGSPKNCTWGHRSIWFRVFKVDSEKYKDKAIINGMENCDAIFPHKIIITERILMKVVTPKLQNMPIPIEIQENNENMKWWYSLLSCPHKCWIAIPAPRCWGCDVMWCT